MTAVSPFHTRLLALLDAGRQDAAMAPIGPHKPDLAVLTHIVEHYTGLGLAVMPDEFEGSVFSLAGQLHTEGDDGRDAMPVTRVIKDARSRGEADPTAISLHWGHGAWGIYIWN